VIERSSARGLVTRLQWSDLVAVSAAAATRLARSPRATHAWGDRRRCGLAPLLHPFAVETYIETFALLFFGDAEPNDHVDDLEQDETADAAHDQRGRNRANLH
jgi:hypothetical protein